MGFWGFGVLGRFKSQIDLTKVLAFLKEETKVNKLMKNTEVNAAILGKLMVASAVVESQAYQTSSS